MEPIGQKNIAGDFEESSDGDQSGGRAIFSPRSTRAFKSVAETEET